jgi:replicative DNA helicase
MTAVVEAAKKGELGSAISSPSTVPAAVEEKERPFEFDERFQAQILALATKDSVFMGKVDGLIKPEYFSSEVDGAIAKVVTDFFKRYKKSPDLASLTYVLKDELAKKRIRSDLVPLIRDRLREIITGRVPSDRDFVADKVAEFARHRAMENAIIASVSALQKGDFGRIEKLVSQALQVGLSDNGGEYDYWKEIGNRTDHRVALECGLIKPDGITTGIPELDRELMHQGWGRKEVSALLAPAKKGKSMGLGDFAKNAAMAGFNVLICSCEVSARIYSDRIDANLADTMMKELRKSAKSVQSIIERLYDSTRHGHIKIHEFPSGTLTPSQLRRLIANYRTRGIIFDVIVVDYADIMAPDDKSDVARENSNSIWLALRAIATEENAAVLTATQSNREGFKAVTVKAENVAEDINKVRHADLVISISATEAEVLAGEARLYFAASRNQEGEFSIRIQQDRSRMKFIKKVLGRV